MKSKIILASVITAATLGSFALATTANAEKVTVKQGDTLSQLAKEFNTSVDHLVKLNGIENANLIFAGDKIITKAEDKTEAPAQAPEQAPAQAPTQEVSEPTPTVQAEPEPVVEEAPVVNEAPVVTETPTPTVGGSEYEAKEEIAMIESGGSYTAQNGQYIGRYQLTNTYLGGDYSPANQERVADAYVASRYGSWQAALGFHYANGWY